MLNAFLSLLLGDNRLLIHLFLSFLACRCYVPAQQPVDDTAGGFPHANGSQHTN